MRVHNIEKYLDEDEVETFEKFKPSKSFDDGTRAKTDRAKSPQKSKRKEKVRMST
jgi:hypothetical protein